jgi:hypothetical protein
MKLFIRSQEEADGKYFDPSLALLSVPYTLLHFCPLTPHSTYSRLYKAPFIERLIISHHSAKDVFHV